MKESNSLGFSAKKLRSRWTVIDNERIVKALNSGSTEGLGVAHHEVEGVLFWDLRGVHLTTPVLDATLENLDLSYSRIDCLGGCHSVLRNCRLCHVKCPDCVLSLRASSSDLSDTQFGEIFGEYTDCRFLRTNFSRVSFPIVKFVRCDFTESNWKGTHAAGCYFENCIWEGCEFSDMTSLAEAKFVGTMPNRESLGDALLDGMVFEPNVGAP